MSSSDYREISNALNNYYGNKMNLYEEGTKYREEYRQKMKEQKKLVKELSVKAEAFDRILEEMDSAGKTMYKKESLVQYAVENAFWNIDGIIVDYESGEME